MCSPAVCALGLADVLREAVKGENLIASRASGLAGVHRHGGVLKNSHNVVPLLNPF
jgi:hypothetical protein